MESVDTAKKAEALEKGRAAITKESETANGRDDEAGKVETVERLRVFVQVNTSGEESKSGVEPGQGVLQLCRHIREKTPHLRLQGLMTIGAIARSQDLEEGKENEDFIRLKEVRDEVQKELGGDELELSMGMSGDFESAVRLGSDEVRVGTGIFGDRPRKEDAIV